MTVIDRAFDLYLGRYTCGSTRQALKMRLRKCGIIGLLCLLLTACTSARAPAEPDLTTTQTSMDGHFAVTLSPKTDSLTINELTSWTLSIQTSDGQPVTGGQVTVSGGMPAHDHGFPTEPVVTERSGGAYLVEGVRFHMGGLWEMTFTIATDDITDSVTFNVVLP